ncbi:MAG: polyprenyl synthetase family protein [Pseudoflavonifractor sp.]|nr:polyprenyl synthetase family protein [Pseudoflavonifractor sp.]
MVSREILTDCINEAIASINYPVYPTGLYEPIAYTLEGGGKRLRPVLTLASCAALGADHRVAIKQAMGVEMFHNFTLLHDDVMDCAAMRRGRPTVHCRWNESTAILSGDAMLTMATQLVSDCPADKLMDVLTLFNRTAMEVYEGQQYDMNFESRDDVTVDEYMEMIRLKTSVLLACACRLGAIMAGADNVKAQALYDFGVNLGLAFQLQDDWLDTYGDPKVFGKNIGGDILNAKKTFLLITALDRLGQEGRRGELIGLLDAPVADDEKIKAVTALYDSTGAARACRDEVERYGRMAVDALSRAGLPDDAMEFFVRLVEDSSCRDK